MPKTQEVKPSTDPVTNPSTNPFKTILYVLLALALFVIIFGAGALSLWFYQSRIAPKPSPTPVPTIAPLPSPVVSIEPSPEVSLTPPAPSPTEFPGVPPQSPTDIDLLKESFGNKYNHPASEANVTISKMDGPYASGGITFSGEMGGGWFLAYKKDGVWIIAADGNGVVECDKIAPYNFPVSMAPECWDNNQQKLITR